MRTCAERIESRVGEVERGREGEEGGAGLCEGTMERVGSDGRTGVRGGGVGCCNTEPI